MATEFSITALEILGSRGRPPLQVTATLGSGHTGAAGVPSSASADTREVVELRDADSARYAGSEVRRALGHVRHDLADAVVGVLLAVASALAAMRGEPLWRTRGPQDPRLPVPHINVVNGGAHAADDLDFQEFMIASVGAPSFAEAVRDGAEVYAVQRRRLAADGHSVGLDDEGGFAPAICEPEAVLDLLVHTIADAGYTPSRTGVAIALDPAANGFHTDGGYQVAGQTPSSSALIDRYEMLVSHCPIWSIEDGLDEEDWDGWTELTERLGDRNQIVGDDIFVTDLAVVSGCGQLKSRAPARGERVAKYNRLLQVSAANPRLPFGIPGR